MLLHTNPVSALKSMHEERNVPYFIQDLIYFNVNEHSATDVICIYDLFISNAISSVCIVSNCVN